MGGYRRVDEQFRERLVSWSAFVVVWSPVHSSSCGAQLIRRRVGAQLVRRRQSAGVGVGAFGSGSVRVSETRAARTRGADGTPGKFLFLLFLFHLVFWGVCVCEASSDRVELE